MNYDDYIISKKKTVKNAGFEPLPFIAPLFDWQAHIVRWAVQKGRCALFEDCGLGKTIQHLEWASQVVRHTGGSVLILTPLAVAQQTVKEGIKFGIEAHQVANADEVNDSGIWITNYEKLEHFDCSVFAGVVLDESSCLKSLNGKTRQSLTEAFKDTPYRLCCTATPSPNDYTELRQHADFLGVCSTAQMLSTFFINDTFNTGDWRLKKHAEVEFWKWLASWAACISTPSDIGFENKGYDLPPLKMETILVDADESVNTGEDMFRIATLSATTMHSEMRMTSPQRADAVANLVNNSDEHWLVWCNTNDEADALSARIPDAVDVRGSDSAEKKTRALNDFAEGRIRVLLSKPSIAGFGMNFQHCRNVAFVGLSYSFEDFYQALRRSYRFGQTRQVNAYIVQAKTEGAILKAINRKIYQHKQMQENMKLAAKEMTFGNTEQISAKLDIDTYTGENWTLHHGDCVRVAKQIPDGSIDFSVFSLPFADLFTYSNDLQDMGNCSGLKEFMVHFDHLIVEMKRIMQPGREVAVHCVDLLSSKWKDGVIQFQDFSGEIIRAFWKHNFLFHSRICIWKSPVTEMQRTKAHGLLHKTLRKNSADSRVGCADYLLVFRAPGQTRVPVVKDGAEFPVSWWQEVASPVWMTVNQGRVLNGAVARDNQDEKHICPLQLDVIERAITLWSNPGDLVYSPFTGIGSEGYGALTLGRRFVGSELKKSYADWAVANMKSVESQPSLF
jgi:DNA modification methylase/superfamily II DNA or RNA helicase